MQNNRKILIISVVALTVVVVVLIVLFGRRTTKEGEPTFLGKLFPESESVAPPSSTLGFNGEKSSVFPAGAKEAGTITSIEAKNLPVGTLIRLSKDVISSLAVLGTTTRYHKNIAENPGHLFEREADGSNEESRISNFTIPQILKIVWSPDATRAVIFYNLDEEIRKILVDYTESTPKTNFLPDTVSAIAFSPDSKSIVFINSLSETHNIFTTNTAFTSQKKILDNNIPNLEISWPAQNIIAFKTKSSHSTPGFLYTITANGSNFQKVVESSGLDAVWNKDGSQILYTDSDLNLFYLNVKTGEQKSLGFKTVAEKCVFDNGPASEEKNMVYCAIPKIVSGTNYPDKWWQGKVAFLDNIAGINTSTLDLVFFAETLNDAVNPMLLENDTYFLFKDRNTGELWSLKLK